MNVLRSNYILLQECAIYILSHSLKFVIYFHDPIFWGREKYLRRVHAICKGLYVNILRGTFVTMTLRVARIVRTPLHWRKAKVNAGTSRIERLRGTSTGTTYDLNEPRVHLFRFDFNAALNLSIYSTNAIGARLIGTAK